VPVAVVALILLLGPVSRPAEAQRPVPSVGAEVAPPTEIEGLEARPVTPLEFSRAWLGRAAAVRERRAELQAAGKLDGMDPWTAARQGAALAGVLRVPVIPVRYSDVAEPFPVSLLQQRLFGAGSGDTVSYSQYWNEVSGGLLRVEGQVMPWIKLNRPANHYLASQQYGWSQFGRMGELWTEVVRAAERSLDLGAFDNDGPDGVPNSGDDDGYVDFVVILYATDCHKDWRAGSIWPHRGAMQPILTRQTSKSGGRLKMTDYLILPVMEPGTCNPLHLGVLAHETGHALGLPDLYDYDGTSQGVGGWDLMALGSQSAPHSPAHVGAWVKEQFGWVQVDWLKRDVDGLVIPPVGSHRKVFRYDLPGPRGEYLLLENRQQVGSDKALPGRGLLVWRVDPQQGELGEWNGDEQRPAVSLIQADGRDDLQRGLPADAGDPFPGASQRSQFTVDGTPPFVLERIREAGETSDLIVADLRVDYQSPTLVATPGIVRFSATQQHDPPTQRLKIRGMGGATGWSDARSAAPWLVVERVGDELLVRATTRDLEPGAYSDTIQLSGSGEDHAAGRVPVELVVARPGEAEIIATRLPWSWGLAALQDRLVHASYAWDPLGLRPQPRLLQFEGGATQNETLVRLPADALFSPLAGDDGSIFVLSRARGKNLLYRVEADGRSQALGKDLGDTPAYGIAKLPDNSVVVADWNGKLQRVTPDGAVQDWGDLRTNIYQLASDSRGTLFAATYDGNVIRIEPDGAGSRVLETGFKAGQLVAVAAGENGWVYAAERGGEGRVIRISAKGERQLVARVPGAQFYGVAVDDTFLYATDLRNRNLLRVALPPTASTE
jgi:M6 family metalloprotease-like protein